MYITELHQFDDTVSQRFFVRATFCGVLGETLDLDKLRADFVEVAGIEQIVEPVDHTYTADMLTAAGRNSECRALSNAVRRLIERRVFLNGARTVVF
jgi:formyltetrahydrofolate hydrolase